MAAAKSAAGAGQLSPNSTNNRCLTGRNFSDDANIEEERDSNHQSLFSTLVDTIKAGKSNDHEKNDDYDNENYNLERNFEDSKINTKEGEKNYGDHHEQHIFRGNFHG